MTSAACERCGHRFDVPDGVAGEVVFCPRCFRMVRVKQRRPAREGPALTSRVRGRGRVTAGGQRDPLDHR